MHHIKIRFFGITREITKKSELLLPLEAHTKVSELLARLKEIYPELCKLSSLAVAVNEEYAGDEIDIYPSDEIALIPPVSGG